MTRKPSPDAKRTEQQRKNVAIVATLLTLAAGAATWNFYITPTQASIQETQSRIDTLDSQIQQAISIRDQLPQLREENTRLQAQLATFRQSFPKEESLANLVITIGELARENNIELGAITRNVTIREGTSIKQIALSTSAKGTFPNLYAFMKDIQRQQRYLSLEKPTMSVSEDGMSANLTINAFVLMSTVAPPRSSLDGIPAQPGAASTAPDGIKDQKQQTKDALEGSTP